MPFFGKASSRRDLCIPEELFPEDLRQKIILMLSTKDRCQNHRKYAHFFDTVRT